MHEIKEFVYDPNTEDKIRFNVQSYALRKALDRNVNDLYADTGIYVESYRSSCWIAVRKTTKFK